MVFNLSARNMVSLTVDGSEPPFSQTGHFQRAIRNRTAHAYDRYTESHYKEVKDLMGHVASFMQHLASKIGEVPMPGDEVI